MTLEELLGLWAGSASDDWNVITCWGANTGPPYLDEFIPMEAGGEYQLRHNSHSMRGVFKPDIAITIGWGLSPGEAFPDPAEERPTKWSEVFPDTAVGMAFLDFFYCGSLAHRERYADVDGGRSILPWPNHELAVSQRSHDLIRVLDRLANPAASDFDSYLQRAKFKVT
jgi:hypothetical protein